MNILDRDRLSSAQENPPQSESVSLAATDSKRAGIERLQSMLERKAKHKPRAMQMAAYLRTIPEGSDSEIATLQELLASIVKEDGEPDRTAQRRLKRQHMPEWAKARKCACKLEGCGNWLHFRHYFTKDELRLIEGNYCCQTKLCPECAAMRGARHVAAYLKCWEHLQDTRPDLFEVPPVMITLTVKNGPDLAERFDALQAAFRKLQDRRRQCLKGNGRGWTEFAKIEGAIFSTEVTNRGNGFHPHMHGVCLLRAPVDQAALSQEWLSVTGDSFIVDVRQLGVEDIVKSFCEVFKYSMKFQGMTLENNWRAHLELDGKRMLRSFGAFRGVKVPETLNDEPLEDELPYVDLFFRYLAESGCYSLVSDREFAATGPKSPLVPVRS